MPLKTTLIILLLFFGSFQANATEPNHDPLFNHAASVECNSRALKDCIKTEYCKHPRRGALLALNAQLKIKASAIQRCLKRKPHYSRLDKDTQRLHELACKLRHEFQKTAPCSVCDPLVGAILQDSHCLAMDACHRLGIPVAIVQPVLVPQILSETSVLPEQRRTVMRPINPSTVIQPRFEIIEGTPVETLPAPSSSEIQPNLEPVIPYDQAPSVLEVIKRSFQNE